MSFNNYIKDSQQTQNDCGCGCTGAGTCSTNIVAPEQPSNSNVFDEFKKDIKKINEFKSHMQTAVAPSSSSPTHKKQLTKQELQSPHNKKIRNNFLNVDVYNDEVPEEEPTEVKIKISPSHDLYRGTTGKDFSNKISQ